MALTGAGGGITEYFIVDLADLEDVNLTNPQNNDILTYQGGFWVNGSGSAFGDVDGPASSTDNAIARFDGTTGKLIQNSIATIDDSGNLTTVTANLTANTNQLVLGTTNTLTLTMSALSANRTITFPNQTGSVTLQSATQNLLNKTLDNTNNITLLDTNFTLQDDGDNTKQLRFQLSSIGTATTRTLTVPNVNGTIYTSASTTSGSSILKGDGNGGITNASSGTDYAPATSGSSILYGNGSGGFSNVTLDSKFSFSGGTLGFANAAAKTVFGNNSTSSAAPSFTSDPVVNSIDATATGSSSRYKANGVNAYWHDTTNNNLVVGASNAPNTFSQSGGGSNGQNNVAVGANALNANTTGGNNTAVGYAAGQVVTTGSGNFALGNNAMGAVTTGSNNTAIGAGSMIIGAGTDNNNTTIGFQAWFSGTGSKNVIIGAQAGNFLGLFGDSSSNTVIGYQVANGASSFSNCILIGYDSTVAGPIFGSNQLNIQNAIHGTGLGGTSSTPKIGIGNVSSPTAFLHLHAGTTSTAPLRIPSGTNRTSAESGSIENDGTNLFYTNSAPTRLGVVVDNGTRLTSGRVPFAGTNGYLQDDSDMTFSTDTLTVTKIVGSTSIDTPLLNSTGTVRLKGYTVATLPAGTVGDTAYVTDATLPTFLGVLTGGGAITTPVFYNGTTWVSY